MDITTGILYIVIALVISLVGFLLHTNYNALRDGVTNSAVFNAAWWPAQKMNTTNDRVNFLLHMMKELETAKDKHTVAFITDCIFVIHNYTLRKDSTSNGITKDGVHIGEICNKRRAEFGIPPLAR